MNDTNDIEVRVDLSRYSNTLSSKHRMIRLLWGVVWPAATCFLPRSVGMPWKRMWLRAFGAKVEKTANIYSTARVYYPANLEMGEYSGLASDVDYYNVDKVIIGTNTTVSQGAYLCTVGHDITNPLHPLITAPIVIEDQVWIRAKSFIGMGVTIKQGAVVGATAYVYKDIEQWTVVGGNLAKVLKYKMLPGGVKYLSSIVPLQHFAA